MKAINLIVVAVLVLLGVAGYTLFKNLTPFDMQRPAVGESAPEISLKDLSGSMVRLSDYRGKLVLVNFWGSWCSACKEEMPGFKKVFQEYHARGFTVFAVAVNDVPSAVKEFSLSFPVVMADRQVGRDYGDVVHIPVSYLVGKDGKIIRKVKGLYSEADLRSDVEQALR
jgi:peroxiredoxin